VLIQEGEAQVKAGSLLVVIVGALLAGCSSWWPFGGSSAPDRPWYPADATVYKCDGNRTLVVRYLDGGKAAMVMFPEREFRLDAIRTASGVNFSNGRTDLRTQGDDAQLEEDGKRVYDNCKRVPR
jgi:membrane-bound inhibitor of C-type lysozyme